MTDSHEPHVVIVGGGFAGLRTARDLGGASARVTVIDRENHHLFQPLLYQVATAGLGASEIAVPIRYAVRAHENVDVVLGEVTGVDLDAKLVRLRDEPPIAYDYLVLAAGARTTWFGHERWSRHARGLKNVRDALTVRERVLSVFERADRFPEAGRRRAHLNFVVVGGGPTGVEMAGALAELGRRVLAREFKRVRPEDVTVVLLEMEKRLLSGFSEESADAALEHLRELGVRVELGQRVTEVTARGVATEGAFFPASTVVWAPGVEPVELADTFDLPKQKKRITVDRFCRLPAHPEVYVVGDLAAFAQETDESGDPVPLPALASVATQQGAYVAKAIRLVLRGKEPKPFRYVDRGIMATVGRSRAVAERGKVRLHGFIAWMAWIVVHVALLVSFRNRTLVLFDWFRAYLRDERGARLLTRRTDAGGGLEGGTERGGHRAAGGAAS